MLKGCGSVLCLWLLRPALARFARSANGVGLCYSRVFGDKCGQSLVHLEKKPCRSVFDIPICHGTPPRTEIDEQATDLTTGLYASQGKWAVRDACAKTSKTNLPIQGSFTARLSMPGASDLPISSALAP
jgi:hypothetical protein